MRGAGSRVTCAGARRARRVQASDVQPSTEIGGKKEEEIPDEGDDDKKTRKQRTRKEINVRNRVTTDNAPYPNPQRDTRAEVLLTGPEPRIALRLLEDVMQERVVAVVVHRLVDERASLSLVGFICESELCIGCWMIRWIGGADAGVV